MIDVKIKGMTITAIKTFAFAEETDSKFLIQIIEKNLNLFRWNQGYIK